MKAIALELPEDQLVEWVRALPAGTRQALKKALAPGLDDFNRLVDVPFRSRLPKITATSVVFQ
jgi:hypothetical protein